MMMSDSAPPPRIPSAPRDEVMPILDETAFYIVFRTSQGYLGSAQSTPGNPKTKWMPSTFARYATSWADRFGANASWVTVASCLECSDVSDGGDGHSSTYARYAADASRLETEGRLEPPPLFVADLGDATLGDGGQGAAGRDGAAAVKYVELVSRAVYGERPAIVGSIHVQVCHRHAFVATVDAHVTGQLGEVPGVAANIDVVLPRALQC